MKKLTSLDCMIALLPWLACLPCVEASLHSNHMNVPLTVEGTDGPTPSGAFALDPEEEKHIFRYFREHQDPLHDYRPEDAESIDLRTLEDRAAVAYYKIMQRAHAGSVPDVYPCP